MDNKLIPSMSGMEETISQLPVVKVEATISRGWWEVRVYVPIEEGRSAGYMGKKDRSCFSALAKSLDEALKTHRIWE